MSLNHTSASVPSVAPIPVDQLPQLWLRQSPTYGLADGKVQETFVIAREVSPTSSVKENYNESEARRFRQPVENPWLGKVFN